MMDRLHAITLLFLVMTTSLLMAQPKDYSFEQLDSLQRTEQRPVVVFLHADWCTICQAMLSTTLRDEGVIHLLDEHFYFVDFDGESERPVNFKGHKFGYKPTGANTGIHELAEVLGSVDGKIAFPTTVIMNPEFGIIFRHNTYLGVKEFSNILNESKSAASKGSK